MGHRELISIEYPRYIGGSSKVRIEMSK
ncbi:uncharacterized protein G2W53_029162 [Senna tora]|uniref:Uncharacterized protein n=1 Tax=Senna tora TaxID=362788 RepID=A0A834WBJ6_9FABA|nr:uncharacterized protein G2W53_029162 [Senna tora]